MKEAQPLRFSDLVDWVEGRLSEEEARAVAARVSQGDESVQQDLAWLRTFHRIRQTVRLASPPSRVREVLQRRFADYASKRQPPGIFRRLLAELSFDSRSQPAPAGVRSAAAEGLERQLIYSTEVAEIALNLRPHVQDEGVEVTGQVFSAPGAAEDTFTLQLLHDTVEVSLATTDELGEFALGAVPAGEYELVVSAGQFEVVLPSVPLRV